ncbi:MAG: PfkB family carbohydrate kinase [Acidobacteria bacterium]|nr:PfkB family carbohydrate kinase [Acidobacteriota bacterium]
MNNPLLVVGSVALDTVETPFGRKEEVLGGSASYFSLAASYFHPVRVVAIVGTDFGPTHRKPFRDRPIDLEGLVVASGKTFRWGGVYGQDPNERETLFTELNVFEHFRPELPPGYRDSQFIFLGNIDPALQSIVLDQVPDRRFVGCDTMNFWIQSQIDSLKKTMARVDALLINDQELYQLAGKRNLLRAAGIVLGSGPRLVVVKRGEFGAVLVSGDQRFLLPALALDKVQDPTGAGDSFAGGFMGHLARTGELGWETFRQAVIWGTVMASFCVESFSVDGLIGLGEETIRKRYQELRDSTRWGREEPI